MEVHSALNNGNSPCHSFAAGRWLSSRLLMAVGGHQEMYFRHLYASMQPSLEQRCDSWDNYCLLFNIILNSQVNMQVLPALFRPAHCPAQTRGPRSPQRFR